MTISFDIVTDKQTVDKQGNVECLSTYIEDAGQRSYNCLVKELAAEQFLRELGIRKELRVKDVVVQLDSEDDFTAERVISGDAHRILMVEYADRSVEHFHVPVSDILATSVFTTLACLC